MPNTIQLRRSAVQGAVPTTTQLALGELAINTYDGKLYLKKNVSGTESIVEIGALGSTIVGVSNGGTGVSTLTSNYLIKGNGTSAVSASLISDDGTYVRVGGTSGYLTTSKLGVQASSGGISLALTDATTNTLLVKHSATPNAPVIGTNGSALALASNGTSSIALFIDNSQNIGIGNTSPGKKLDVTGDIRASGVLISNNSVANEGGEIQLALASTNTTLTTSVTIDIYQNKLRIFETGGTNRGAYIDLSAASAGVASNLLAGGSTTPSMARTFMLMGC